MSLKKYYIWSTKSVKERVPNLSREYSLVSLLDKSILSVVNSSLTSTLDLKSNRGHLLSAAQGLLLVQQHEQGVLKVLIKQSTN